MTDELPPLFTVQKLSNHGASNPIVARLAMQTMDLLQVTKLSEEKRGALLRLYGLDLTRRLLKIHDAHARIRSERDRTITETARIEGDGRRTIPFIIGLTDEVETILVEAKSVIRETLKVFEIAFDKSFKKSEASTYLDKANGSVGDFEYWAIESLGKEAQVLQVVRFRRPLIPAIVDMRNASEHPGGWVGTLVIENFRRAADGTLVPPTWRIDGKKPREERPLLTELTLIEGALLYFCEELIAATALSLSAAGPALVLGEIPEAERDPKSPVRLRWLFAKAPVKQQKPM